MKNDEFTQQVIAKLQIQDLPPQDQQALLDKVEQAANLRFANSLPSLLTDEQYKEAQRLQESGKKPEEVVAWIKEQLPNLDEILQAIILDIADEMTDE